MYSSRLFATGEPVERYFKDMERLGGIEPAAFEKFCTAWPSPSTTMTDAAEKEMLSLAKETGVSVGDAASGIAVANAIFRQVKEEEDDLTAILDDTFASGKVDESKRSNLEANLAVYEHTIQASIESELLAHRKFQGTFPVLDHIHTRTASFCTYGKEYDVTKDTAEDYDPESCKQELVTVVQLDIDSFGDKTCLSFAVREGELDRLITRLDLARKQLTYAKGELGNG